MSSQSDSTHNDYLEEQGLSSGQQCDVRSCAFVPGTQTDDHDVMNAPKDSNTTKTPEEVPII